MIESRCYVYAIVQREARIPADLTGLGDAPLSIVPWQDLAAVASPIESATLPATPANVLRHEAVVEALCQAGPVLPARFGTILADPAAVAQAIAEKYEVLRADLARVGDKVELGLTILWDTPAKPDEVQTEQQMLATQTESSASGAGKRYLEAKLALHRREAAQQHQARAIIADLEQALRPYLLEQRCRVLSLPRLAVRAAYLVLPQHVQEVQRAVDELRQKQPELRWLLSGPWPPYTFVTGAGKPFQ
ncbi:MAG TPA: GvpL/GvpF family gas vesicle protein [Ktedonobacterales bacterium]|nr:GvpL/GvpF family gas vesicle protein [Ktedonobacterales bacterium]